MTDTIPIFTLSKIHVTLGDTPNYITSNEVCPISGDLMLKIVPDILESDRVYDLRPDLVAELFRISDNLPYAIVRELDDRELICHNQGI